MPDPKLVAQRDFAAFTEIPYHGRGFIMGMDETGKFVIQLYFITGRSEPSKNRVLSQYGGMVYTEVADPSKPAGNPELTLYNAMLETGNDFVVSNGRQTDEILAELQGAEEGEYTSYEPDDNSTPRITGMWLHEGENPFQIQVARRSLSDDTTDQLAFGFESIAPGFGRGVHTYGKPSGEPLLPSWQGEPWFLPMKGTPDDIMDTYWQVLSKDLRVSMVLKAIDLEAVKNNHPGPHSKVFIRNEFEKVV